MIFKIIIFIISVEFSLAANNLFVICIENFKNDDLRIDSSLIDKPVNILNTGGLIPVFPVKSLPNLLTISTGLLPVNHGIISNNFIDPVTGDNFSISNISDLKSSDNYNGVFIWEHAKKNKIRTSSFNWPSSNVFSIRKSVDHPFFIDENVENIKKYLKGVDSLGAKLNLIYLSAHSRDLLLNHDTTAAFKTSIENVNKLLSIIISTIDLSNSNVIIVSTGGYSSLKKGKIISIEDVFIGLDNYKIQNYGSYAFIDGNDSTLKKIQEKLRNFQNIKNYLVDETPLEFNLRNSFLGRQLLLIADNGNLISENIFEIDKLNIKNANGYDPFSQDMIGVFIALGNEVKNIRTGSVLTVDIYPLIIELLGLNQHNLIDGDPNKIRSLINK